MIAQRLVPFGTTIFTEMTLLAQAHGAVNLAQGFPDFDGPEFVKRAAIGAIESGQNQYARMFGIPVLNRAIAAAWERDTGVEIDPDAQVTVTSGCTEAIAAAMLGLLNPGDEVILFEPYYDSYRACVAMAGATARFVSLRPEGRGFRFDPNELGRAFTSRTRMILVNTPHNPTGKVFDREELGLIADQCLRHGTVALTDEVYERLTYEPSQPHVRLATLPGMAERTITLSSLGKTFSLTGWKIGWAVASPEATRAIRAAHQFLTFATATALQHGAAAALADSVEANDYIRGVAATYRTNRDFLGGVLERIGCEVFYPPGAYFIMARWGTAAWADRYKDDVEFCRDLTARAGVAAIPPSVFYENKGLGNGFARFAFCKQRTTLEEAGRRLEAWAARAQR